MGFSSLTDVESLLELVEGMDLRGHALYPRLKHSRAMCRVLGLPGCECPASGCVGREEWSGLVSGLHFPEIHGLVEAAASFRHRELSLQIGRKVAGVSFEEMSESFLRNWRGMVEGLGRGEFYWMSALEEILFCRGLMVMAKGGSTHSLVVMANGYLHWLYGSKDLPEGLLLRPSLWWWSRSLGGVCVGTIGHHEIFCEMSRGG